MVFMILGLNVELVELLGGVRKPGSIVALSREVRARREISGFQVQFFAQAHVWVAVEELKLSAMIQKVCFTYISLFW